MSYFPWKKILAYLADSGAEHDIQLFCYKALIGLEKLVNADGSVLQMIGPGRTLLPSSKTHNFSEKALEQYRHHYFKLDPGRATFPDGVTAMAAKWSDFKENKEIVEFLEANGIRSSGGVFLYDYNGSLFAFLNIHKSSKRGFTKKEIAVMHMVQPHLNNLLINLSMPGQPGPDSVTYTETGDDHKILSRRETEIVGYLCRRFSTRQIAAVLRISPRTVERHVEHIYNKLGIRKRQDLLKLFVTGSKKDPRAVL